MFWFEYCDFNLGPGPSPPKSVVQFENSIKCIVVFDVQTTEDIWMSAIKMKLVREQHDIQYVFGRVWSAFELNRTSFSISDDYDNKMSRNSNRIYRP